jgi:hypothetical protein
MANTGKIDGAQVSIARLPGGAGARAPESVYRTDDHDRAC